jgi:addiction module HigA family antidote
MSSEVRLRNIHPGEILLEEFMKPLGLTAYRVAKSVGVSQTQVGEIIRGERSVTAATALRLAALFGTSAQFWLNMQARYDLEAARGQIAEQIAQIRLIMPVRDEKELIPV